MDSEDGFGSIAAFGLGVLTIALLVLFFEAATHDCPKGHYWTHRIEGRVRTEAAYGSRGDVFFVPVYVPEHDVTDWVCDEPASERGWCRGKPAVGAPSH